MRPRVRGPQPRTLSTAASPSRPPPFPRADPSAPQYVMSLAINPKDTNTFASACLDRTVKIWSLGSSTANSTIEAHDTKGVNHVEYYPFPDRQVPLQCQ